MFNIEQFLNLDNYVTDTRLARRSGSGSTQEFFTPYSIVKHMCDMVPEEDWADPTKTFLEPCAGNFQFILYIIYNRIMHGIDWITALKTCYGLELMQDNIVEGMQRVLDMLSDLADEKIIDYDYNDVDIAVHIMSENIVCHDFFTWNFEEWRPYTEEELKKKNKKNIISDAENLAA